MNTKIFPQALVLVPRSPVQCLPPKKLRFSTAFGHSSLCYSASRVSWTGIGSNVDAITAAFARQRIVARAEADSGEAEAVEEVENVEAAEEAVSEESEEEVEVEEAVRQPRNPRIKLGDIMGILNKKAIEASDKERPIPDIRTGDIVAIKLQVPRKRRRFTIYKGIVISKQNAGIHTTIRIRRIIAGIGVEIVFPLYSPNVKEVTVVSHRKVRRARLYYLRDKLPRFSTFK